MSDIKSGTFVQANLLHVCHYFCCVNDNDRLFVDFFVIKSKAIMSLSLKKLKARNIHFSFL